MAPYRIFTSCFSLLPFAFCLPSAFPLHIALRTFLKEETGENLYKSTLLLTFG